MAVPFRQFYDTFVRADNASPGNLWADTGNVASSASIASNKLHIPTGGTIASRRAPVARPLDEVMKDLVVSVFLTWSTTPQVPSVWVCLDVANVRGIRCFIGSTNKLTITKVTAMDNPAAQSVAQATGTVNHVVSTVYKLEISRVGYVYTATSYASNGTTVIDTCTFTDVSAEKDAYAAPLQTGLSAQETTDFYNYEVQNLGAVSFRPSNATITNVGVGPNFSQQQVVRLNKNASGPRPVVIPMNREGGHAVNVTVVSVVRLSGGLPTGVTNPSNLAPGTAGVKAVFRLQASGSATQDLTGTVWRAVLTDGVDNFPLYFTVYIHNNALAADIIQSVCVAASTWDYSDQFGGLKAKITSKFTGTNAKSGTHITNGSYDVMTAGSDLDNHEPESSTDQQWAYAINQCMLLGVRTVYGCHFLSAHSADSWTAFGAASVGTRYGAILDAYLQNGITVVLTDYKYKFDSETVLTTSTISSVSGDNKTFGVTSYTFTSADVGRWLLIKRDTTIYMYGQISSQNGTTCTLDFPFAADYTFEGALYGFTATAGMVALVSAGVRAGNLANYNIQQAKFAYDSGDATAKSDGTTLAKVYAHRDINGVDSYRVLRYHLSTTDKIHVGEGVLNDPGYLVQATFIANLHTYHHLVFAVVSSSLTPVTDAITTGNTSQLAWAAPTGFTNAELAWTVGFPVDLIGTTASKQSGPGTFNSSYLYTANGGVGVAVCRVALSNNLDKYDESSITVTSADTTAPTLTTAVVGAPGLSTVISLSEAGCVYGSPNASHWSMLVGGNAVAISNAAFATNQVTLTHGAVYAGQTGSVTFTGAANRLEDAAGNDMVTQTVSISTNGSTVPNPAAGGASTPMGPLSLSLSLTPGGARMRDRR